MTSELIHGDAITAMQEMKASSCDLILTDPPFKVISGGANVGQDDGRPSGILAKNDGKIFKHNSIKPADYYAECFRVLRPGRDAYFMTNNIGLREALNVAAEVGFKFHGMLPWIKNTCTPSRWYMKDTEIVLYFYKGQARAINNPGDKQSCSFDNPRDKNHPTEKPVELMQRFVENSTNPGWKVLDPFMGSGSTGVACLATGRRFVGIEIDLKYYRVAQKRCVPANDNAQIDLEDAIRAAA